MSKTAEIYRMVAPEHLCPWGLKALDLLEHEGFAIEDHHLTSMKANEAYKREHHVRETPQIFIEGKRVGGYEALRRRLGKPPEQKEGVTYQPIVALFSVTFFMALTAAWAMEFTVVRVLELFVAVSMCVLAILKLQDLSAFSVRFLGYDLLARRVVRYSYVYPFVEAGAGVLMIAGLLPWVAAPAALFIGTVGAVSVFKAVYIDKRELKCACVGGSSGVPLGFISLTENLMMVAMAVWTIVKAV